MLIDTEQSAKLIDASGGPRAFAMHLGLGIDDRAYRRVFGWRKRGIPPRIQLDHRLTIRKLQRDATKRGAL